MINRTDLVQRRDRDSLRCGCCYCGHAHTYAAHDRAIEIHKRTEARRAGNWLCLCGQIHPPERDWCAGCYCKQREGADVLATVIDGLARDLAKIKGGR